MLAEHDHADEQLQHRGDELDEAHGDQRQAPCRGREEQQGHGGDHPAITSSEVCPVPWSRKVVSPRATSTPSTTTATGASTAVSAVSECIASRLAPTFFLVRP